MIIVAALIIAGAVVWASRTIATRTTAARVEPLQTASLMALLAPGMSAAEQEPRALLVWQPLARAARTLFPREFSELDQAWGGPFPFSEARLQQAHARWTTDWLAWERAHDAEFKLKALTLEQELGDTMGTPYGRARRDAIEQEKLDRYQRRYEEYSRVAKALQNLR